MTFPVGRSAPWKHKCNASLLALLIFSLIAEAWAQSKQPAAIKVVFEVTETALKRDKPKTIMEVREGVLSYLTRKGYAVRVKEICNGGGACVIPSDKSGTVLDIIIDRPWNKWMTLTIRATDDGKTLLDGTVKSGTWTLTSETGKTLDKAYALLDRLPAPKTKGN